MLKKDCSSIKRQGIYQNLQINWNRKKKMKELMEWLYITQTRLADMFPEMIKDWNLLIQKALQVKSGIKTNPHRKIWRNCIVHKNKEKNIYIDIFIYLCVCIHNLSYCFLLVLSLLTLPLPLSYSSRLCSSRLHIYILPNFLLLKS